MLKEALKYILELSKPEEIEVDGKTYFDSATYEPAKEFYPDTLTINNLTGIVDYLKEGPEAWDNGFFVHVRDFNHVVLYQAMAGDFNQRVPILVARARGCQFDFGNKMGVESFIIALRSMFLNNDDQEYLLKFVSGVKVDANATIEDDGVSQKVTARQGTSSLLTEHPIKPVVLLKPFRTFNEVPQPESEFVFRLGTDSNQEPRPRVSLHECDGEAWKQSAIQSIKEYLLGQELRIPIIA